MIYVLKALSTDLEVHDPIGVELHSDELLQVMDYIPEKTIFPKITILMNDFTLSLQGQHQADFNLHDPLLEVTPNQKIERKKLKLIQEIDKKLNVEFSNSFKLSFSDIQLWERIFLTERALSLRQKFRLGKSQDYDKEARDPTTITLEEAKKSCRAFKGQVPAQISDEVGEDEFAQQFQILMNRNLQNQYAIANKNST